MNTERPGLAELARARPARTALQSVVPLLLATVQGVNALVYDISLVAAAAFAAVMVGFAVGATRHSLAALRASSLDADLTAGTD